MRGGRPLTFGRAAAVLAGVALLAGCAALGGAGYLVRAGWSEARILLRREPIADLLAQPGLDPGLRERFELVLAAREFAAGPLGLTVGDSYRTFAQVEREGTVYVLSAARRDRLEAYTWWYPLLGRLPYRGFFARDAAEKAAGALGRRDLDVEVRPAVAFSTLGWFADPLLSSVAAGTPVAVVETVLHELFHSTLYVAGAAAFNESAASFAGHRGAAAFFCPGGPRPDAERCAEAREGWARLRARGRLFAHLAERLRHLYASRPAPPRRERARTRLAAAAARALAGRGLGEPSELFPPNNARLMGLLLYASRLDAFDRLAPADGELGGALATLVASAREARDPFTVLDALASSAERRYSHAQCPGPESSQSSPQPPSASPPTACSGGSPAGSASSDTTSPMARTSAGGR